MKSIGVTLQGPYLIKNCKKKKKSIVWHPAKLFNILGSMQECIAFVEKEDVYWWNSLKFLHEYLLF